MTPNLFGRWQTRTAMLLTWGVFISLVFALAYNPEERNDFNPGSINEDFFTILITVLILGFAWDILWILLQKFRWDRDWPAAFQWATAAVEGVLVWILLSNGALPGIPAEDAPPGGIFFFHYGLIFLVTYWFVQGPMRAIFPRWRFHGGRIV